tara:strand:+ start:317 stop:1222 length:906 start_codon:yes stop_codon:yes gene_type:complete
MKKKTITLIGGSGFLAKYCIAELLKAGHNLKIVCRNPHLAGHLRMMAPIEQLDIVKGNAMLMHTIEPYVKNSDVVINFVGVLNDSSGGQSFENCHAVGPKNIADLCRKFEVKKLIHFSSIGADIESDSKYQYTKGLGEKNIRDSYPEAIIIRPSIVFGPGDGFFSVQSKLLKSLPVIPLFANNKYQCVYVKDIALATSNLVSDEKYNGKVFEFGGPDTLTLKEIYQLILKTLKIKRIILPVPLSFANFVALIMMPLPSPLITFDQVKLLRKDNVISKTKYNLEKLGISPRSPSDIINTYIS